MKMTAPIYQLKRQAKQLARLHSLPFHQALDQIANRQGFGRWSLLAKDHRTTSPARQLAANLRPGDRVLIGARPGQGKTLLSLELAAEWVTAGRRAMFFSLDYTERDVFERLRHLGIDPLSLEGRFLLDCSDDICAAYIMAATQAAPSGTLVVIDYLQLLDQDRATPTLEAQLSALKSHAEGSGVVLVFLSQIDRRYDPAMKPVPGPGDVRRINPIDLAAFNKSCFLQDGVLQYCDGGLSA